MRFLNTVKHFWIVSYRIAIFCVILYHIVSCPLWLYRAITTSLCEINKNNRANATQGPSLVPKIPTKAMLDRRGPGPGPGPVLTPETNGCHCWLIYNYVRHVTYHTANWITDWLIGSKQWTGFCAVLSSHVRSTSLRQTPAPAYSAAAAARRSLSLPPMSQCINCLDHASLLDTGCISHMQPKYIWVYRNCVQLLVINHIKLQFVSVTDFFLHKG